MENARQYLYRNPLMRRSKTSSGCCMSLLYCTLTAGIMLRKRTSVDWAIYTYLKKVIVNHGTQHDGIIVSEIEKRKASHGMIHLSWNYVVRLDDDSEVVSTTYTQQIIERQCTVYVLGSRCILTDFRFCWSDCSQSIINKKRTASSGGIKRWSNT